MFGYVEVVAVSNAAAVTFILDFQIPPHKLVKIRASSMMEREEIRAPTHVSKWVASCLDMWRPLL